MNRLQAKYQDEIVSRLQKELGLANVHQVPRIEKIVVNVGAGRALNDGRLLETAQNTLTKITGQKPVVTTASKSIAGFKLREGAAIGTKVTLRGQRMYEFLDRLISIVLPRTRDFRGLPAGAFDPQGNYSLGMSDQGVFPELNFDDVTVSHGLQINVVTNSTPEHGRALLASLGFPFERSDNG